MFEFPEFLRIDISEPIDNGVSWLLQNWDAFFDVIRDLILAMFNGVEAVLVIIPWWLLIIGLFYAGWRLYNLRTGITLSIMIFIIGLFGLWDMMIYTLVIVIISVFVSIVLGLPIGILMAKSETSKKIMLPILDAMQTMPSFVYLLPAVMFFGFGRVPAIIATTSYAIAPLIRLTYLGISKVDKEVVEAGKSFGATAKQMLLKIEFPQALPTIMTGINQTTMMAMAMVVISSMIGAEGIGEQVLIAIRRQQIGKGLEAGFGIVFLAIILDRLMQGAANKMKERS